MEDEEYNKRSKKLALQYKEFMYRGLNRCETIEDIAKFFQESADRLTELLDRRKED